MLRFLRWLRIAFSVVCGMICLLSVALWVRSHRYWDQLYTPVSKQADLVIIESASGRAIVRLATGDPGAPWQWHLSRELDGAYWGGALGDWEEANRDQGFAGFAYYATPWHTTYRLPLWFPTLLFAALAIAPWIDWPKRFSLRTLPIVITLAAVGLGAIVWTVGSN